MPSKKRKDGQFKDIAHPLNQEMREYIEKSVFDAYQAEVDSMGSALYSAKKYEDSWALSPSPPVAGPP